MKSLEMAAYFALWGLLCLGASLLGAHFLGDAWQHAFTFAIIPASVLAGVLIFRWTHPPCPECGYRTMHGYNCSKEEK